MSMKKPKLTIIIPAFNEKKTLPILLKKISKIKISKQIIIIDDKSTDGTRSFLDSYKEKVDISSFSQKKSW